MLEQDYKEEFDIEEALNLAMTILSKTLDTQTGQSCLTARGWRV